MVSSYEKRLCAIRQLEEGARAETFVPPGGCAQRKASRQAGRHIETGLASVTSLRVAPNTYICYNNFAGHAQH